MINALVFLGELMVRGLLLGVAGLVASLLFRRRGAEMQHAICAATLIGMMALPFLSMLPATVARPLRVLPFNRVVTIIPASQSTRLSRMPQAGLMPSRLRKPQPRFQKPFWAFLFLAVYAATATHLLLRVAISFLLARYLVSNAKRLPETPSLARGLGIPLPELRISQQVAVPFTVGWHTPVIVLPDNWLGWDEFKFRAVVSHEAAHVRRADWMIALAAAVNRSIFWLQPTAWWMERRLAALAEEACDAVAIRATGDEHRYAGVVLDFAAVAASKPVWSATAMARSSKVGRR